MTSTGKSRMPTVVQQLNSKAKLVLDYDTKLSEQDKAGMILRCLPGAEIKKGRFARKVIVFNNKVILFKQITYLGNPHPEYKKRIQIPETWVDEHNYWTSSGYEVYFIGIYAYSGNVLFASFSPSTYVERRLHNSSAHVYTNDLYQATLHGFTQRLDKNLNEIQVMDETKFQEEMGVGKKSLLRPEIKVFDGFADEFLTTEPLYATDACKEMFAARRPDFIPEDKWKGYWPDVFQSEWQGFYSEFRFAYYLQKHNLRNVVDFVRFKGTSTIDLDLKFTNYWGDIKTSNIIKNEAPGNDKETVLKAIQECGKFWIVLFGIKTEHSPAQTNNFRELEKWNRWKEEVGYYNSKKPLKIHSYSKRFKNYAEYIDMKILEINPINMGIVFEDFKQGHQQDGSSRKTKFNIKKSELDCCTIFTKKCKEIKVF